MRHTKTYNIYNMIIFLALFFSESFAQYTWVDTTDTSGNGLLRFA